MQLLRKISFLLDPKAKRQAVGLFVLMLFGALFEALGIGLIFPFIVLIGDPAKLEGKGLPGRLFAASGLSHQQFAISAAAGLILLFLVKNLYVAYVNYAQYRFAFENQVVLSGRLLSHYLRSPYLFHTQRNSAELLRNVNSEVLWVFNHVVIPLIVVTTELLVLTLIGAVLMAAAPLATLVSFAFLAGVGGAFLALVRRKAGELGRHQQQHMGSMIQWVNQGLGGIKDTKIRGKEDYFLDAYRGSAASYARANIYLKTVDALPRMFIETLGIGALLAGVIVVMAQGDDVVKFLPFMALFAMAAIRIMPSLNRIIGSLTGIRFFAASVDAVYRDLRRDAGEHQLAAPRISGAPPDAPPITFARELAARELHFRYQGREPMVLRGLSLRIAKGSSVALVGASGAGKSTLVDILLGLLNPCSGAVLVDGRPISQNLESWQRLVGYIPQSVYLLDDSIRRNVAFGLVDHEIDEELVWRSLAKAQLDGFVGQLPGRLDSRVGENGVCLSGGQRQRLGIARVLYGDPQVLILDEATSSLDSETEQEIVKVIDRLKGEKTLITIAHRMTSIVNCDTIFLLREGCVSNAGSFEELKAGDPDFQALLRASKFHAVTLPQAAGGQPAPAAVA